MGDNSENKGRWLDVLLVTIQEVFREIRIALTCLNVSVLMKNVYKTYRSQPY
jgi:hypothetical protein